MPIVKVSGKLEVIGPRSFWGATSGEESGSELYSYLRIDALDGKAHLLDRVLARRQVAAFLKPGVAGDFYIMEIGAKQVARVLFAFSNGKSQATDTGIGDRLTKFMKRLELLRLALVLSLTIMGIALIVFLIGWPILGLAIYNLFSYLKLRAARLQIPSSAELVTTLKKAGLPAG